MWRTTGWDWRRVTRLGSRVRKLLAVFASITLPVLCSPVLGMAGPAGSALWFDGADDEIVIPHNESISFSAPPEALTVEMWFKRGGSRIGDYHLLGKRNGCGVINYALAVHANMLVFVTTVDGSWRLFFAPLTTPDTVWTHVAGTADGTEIRLYINGALQTVDPGMISGEILDPLKIGQHGTCGDPYRHIGWVDEVRVWNVARTATEIHDQYDRTIDPATPGLVGYWTFDEDSTDQHVYDSSPFSNHGTLGGSAEPGPDDPSRVPSTAPIDCFVPPCPYAAADVNCDGVINVYDILEAINVTFSGKPVPPPCCRFR